MSSRSRTPAKGLLTITKQKGVVMTRRLRWYGIAALCLIASGTRGLAQNSGADIYKAKCQMCHAADGSANTPAGKAKKARALTAPEVLKESDADLLAIIQNGKNQMPAYKGKLSDEEMKDVLEYVHTLQKK